MGYKFILTSLADHVGTITINRPEITNKLNNECMYEICDAVTAFENESECDVIVLTAVGEYFCNGGELGDSRKKSDKEIRAFGDAFVKVHTRLQESTKLIIGKVQGHVLGGGFSLLEACDLAIAADDVKFGVPEMSVGLAPMMCMVGLKRAASRKTLMEMSMTGEPVDAKRALELEFVNKICPREELDAQAAAYAQRFVGHNPTAVAYTKLMYRSIDGLDYRKQMERGQALLVGILKSPNNTELLNANEEGRAPVWIR